MATNTLTNHAKGTFFAYLGKQYVYIININPTLSMDKSFVSIIIPTYNSKATLDTCLRAVLDQTVPREQYEVLVIDDGSADNTKEIAGKYGVRYYYQTNQGPAAARNKGIREAKGELLFFTDDDCEVEKNWVEEMRKPFMNQEIVGVKGRYKTRQKEIAARFAQLEYEEKYERMARCKYTDFIDTYSAGFRKPIMEKFGGFNTEFKEASGEDTELSFKIAKAGYKMIFAPDAVVYHQHPHTLLKYLKRKIKTAYWRIFIYKHHPDKMTQDSHTPQTLKIQILLFYILLGGLLSLLFTQKGWAVAGISLLAFLTTTATFTFKTVKKDPSVGILSPFLLFLRATVFGLGLLGGTWDCLFPYKKIKNA